MTFTKWEILKGKLFYYYGRLWQPLFYYLPYGDYPLFNFVLKQFGNVRHPLYEMPREFPEVK